MAKHVFISHSSEDEEAAYAACAVLERNGLKCWIAPRDISPGQTWAERLVAEIEASSVVVLIFSSHANKSEHVHREVEVALERNVPIFTVRIEDVPPSEVLEYAVADRHWMNVLEPLLEVHYEQLARSIGDLIHETALAESRPLASRRAVAGPMNHGVVRGSPRSTKLLVGLVSVVLALSAVAGWKLRRRPPAHLVPDVASSAVAPAAHLPDVERRPSDCPSAHVVAATGPRGVTWPWMRQTLAATPELRVVGRAPAAPGEVSFRVYDYDAKNDALVAQCDGETCARLAETYKRLVPAARPERVRCGQGPTFRGNARVPRLVDASHPEANVPDRNDLRDNYVRESCARLGVCLFKERPSTQGDPGIECQSGRRKLDLSCAQRTTCAEVVACLEAAR